MYSSAGKGAAGLITPPTAPIYTATRANFAGSQYLTKSVSGLEAFDTNVLTIAADINVTNLSGIRTVLSFTDGLGPRPWIAVQTDGSIQIAAPTAVGTAGYLVTVSSPAGTIVPGTRYVIHVVGLASGSQMQLFVNGQEQTLTAPSGGWQGLVFSHTGVSEIIIGAGPVGSAAFVGSMGFVWIDGASYITDPAKFYSTTEFPLGSSGNAPSGTVPEVFFGCTQSIASWNAGTNGGTGGNFTVTGTLT